MSSYIPDFDISDCYKGEQSALREVWVKRCNGWRRCRFFELMPGDKVFLKNPEDELGETWRVTSQPCKEVCTLDPAFWVWGINFTDRVKDVDPYGLVYPEYLRRECSKAGDPVSKTE